VNRVIRVIGAVGGSSFYNQDPPHKTKYYNNNQRKEVVKKDFQIFLDTEIKKLKIDILI
jgi:hypothetical protein